MATIAGRQVETNDLGVMGAGAAALLFSFLPYWGVSYKIAGLGGASSSVTAWHSYATLGLLLLVAAAAVVAARVFGGVTLPDAPIGWHVIVAAAAVLGALLVILRGLTIGSSGFNALGSSVSAGVKWGGYLLFLAAIAEAVFAVMALRASGEPIAFGGAGTDLPPPAAT